MSGLELVSAGISLLCVWLFTRQNVWSWPLAILGAALYMVVFWQARLYADMGLQGCYVVISAYGWYEWLFGGPGQHELRVSRTRRTTGLVLAALVACSTLALGWLLSTYTDADLAYWDSFTTTAALAAQWMLAKKFLENWLVWIGVDALAAGIYVYKGLYPTAGLYAVFLILAVSGYTAWRKSMVDRAGVPA